jgi:Flp pilus assembly protein TadD
VELGNLRAAEREYREAIALAPGKDDAYCGLGVVLFQEGNPSGAIVQFIKAQQADPLDSTPYYDLATVYQHLGRFDAAVILYRKVLELKPGEPSATAALHRLESR